MRRWAPGLVVTAAAVVVAVAVARLQPVVGALLVALVLGVLVVSTGAFHPVLRPGVTGATKRLLRAGIVVLGLQLAVGDVLALGPAVLVLVAATVVGGYLFTAWAGRRLGLSPAGATLMAAGFSICGASAIAGLQGVVDADDDEVASALAAVTLYGSLCIVALPLLGATLGLSEQRFGLWVGLALPEVAQVVAAAGTAGTAALAVATVAKLGRVVLLAPVAAAASWRARAAASAVERAGGAVEGAARSMAGRAPLVPLFVLGFLAAVALRSVGAVPAPVVAAAPTVTTVLLAGAMFGLGTGISPRQLARSGGPWLVVGALSTTALTAFALAGTALV